MDKPTSDKDVIKEFQHPEVVSLLAQIERLQAKLDKCLDADDRKTNFIREQEAELATLRAQRQKAVEYCKYRESYSQICREILYLLGEK